MVVAELHRGGSDQNAQLAWELKGEELNLQGIAARPDVLPLVAAEHSFLPRRHLVPKG